MQYWDKRYARNLARYGLAVMSVLRTVVNRGENPHKPEAKDPHKTHLIRLIEYPFTRGNRKVCATT